MKCFYYFKDKSRTREQKSAPELKNRSQLDNSAGSGAVKSSCSDPSRRSIPELFEENAHKLRVFSFSELRTATSDFNRLLKIGEGGFGCVYKASIKPADGREDRIVVAVKKLNKDGLQGHKQWVAEVQFLGIVEHPNLVKLIGYCAVDGERGIQRLLVYEFMPNRSLEDHLFNRVFPILSWQTRLQIVIGAAQGLAYLHEELEAQVIYRDFKSSNILLDEDFKPKLSDFGLAREGPTDGHTHVSTTVTRKIAKLADSCLCKNSKERPKMSQVVEHLKQAVQVSEEGSSFEKCSPEFSGADQVESENNMDPIGVTESMKRRMAHLTKLSENATAVGKRKFLIMQRPKVT
ncbi:hypothetical protein HHK36_028113 [Tetracentron sinense]|uniref:Protein kinase domain-containing protein n=1 Tax=Tetracentron sinense TaxID=13715 RepID=A0A834YG01_TETSI|nr:hypothetical protein HHK36_028113 [Tetracentron sinense]